MPQEDKVITKAVIAAAGFGTRFLPQTKAMPKEMLPLIDKPIIQYVVEELVSVGVKDIIIVTGYSKRAIEDHFDRPIQDLIENLKQGGAKKKPYLDQIKQISELANFIYVRQKGVYGSGTPLLNTEHLVGNEPFYYTWSDDFFVSNPPRFAQMLKSYNKFKAPILSSFKVSDPADYSKYGFLKGDYIDNQNIDVTDLIEKPGIDRKPSDMAIVSGFILTPEVFPYFHQQQKLISDNSEFYATDALKLMLQDNKKIIGCEINNGKYYDVGNILDYHKTVIEFALQRKEIASELKKYIRTLV